MELRTVVDWLKRQLANLPGEIAGDAVALTLLSHVSSIVAPSFTRRAKQRIEAGEDKAKFSIAVEKLGPDKSYDPVLARAIDEFLVWLKSQNEEEWRNFIFFVGSKFAMEESRVILLADIARIENDYIEPNDPEDPPIDFDWNQIKRSANDKRYEFVKARGMLTVGSSPVVEAWNSSVGVKIRDTVKGAVKGAPDDRLRQSGKQWAEQLKELADKEDDKRQALRNLWVPKFNTVMLKKIFSITVKVLIVAVFIAILIAGVSYLYDKYGQSVGG